MTSTQQPPHLISALEDLDRDLDQNERDVLEVIEAPKRRQPGALVEVWLVGDDEPFTVRITNQDHIARELTAARHKEWPSVDVGRNFAMTFLTWSAAKRAELTALNFDQWRTQLVDYNVIDEAPADPTR
jgi:hypothetical protein